MNSESKPKIQRTQASKPASYKRVHRANRPVLVTAETDQATEQAGAEALQSATQVAVEEYPVAEVETPRRRMPAFFTSIVRSNKGASEEDQRAARMARATRGKAVRSSQEEAAPAKKPAKSGTQAKAAPQRPRSMFKMRYVLGMMLYVLIAEYLGTFLQAWMRSNHMEKTIFTWGAFSFTSSTLLFLAILVVILVILAKLDLIPTSLRKMMDSDALAPRGSSAATGKKKQDEPTFETRASRPTAKQGVKGEDDDLYQVYRSNQRYFQKKDRKR